jgi:hypothetical protein
LGKEDHVLFGNLETFAGRPVADFTAEGPNDFERAVPRLRVEYDADQTAVDLLGQLLATGEADRLTALVIGAWAGELYDHSPADVVEALVAAADQLPSLRALFIGDIASEENEVSWIHQSDLSALWQAFPRLEVLGIRGSNGLSLGQIRHNHLRELTIECGGLPREVLSQLASASLPALEHLEIYLGTENYGWDGTIDDVKPLLTGQLFPKLKYLGLRDSEIADQVAQAAATSPLVGRIETLDLSLGTLGDAGAEALLASPAVKKLKRLDLHYHYLSPAVMERLAKLGPEVDVSELQSESEYGRYVSVGE